MQIAFFEIAEWEIDYLKEKLKGNELLFFNDSLSEDNIKTIEDVDVISVFIGSKVDNKVLKELKKLKAVVTRSTGFDHIDINACKKRKVKILNVPEYGSNTVAEHTFALILALSRRIHKSYERTVRGDFSLDGLKGWDLKNKTLGVIGVGSIGEHVVRIARGFDMKVLAYDVNKNQKLARKLKFNYVPLRKLLKDSDIVSLHCPYNKKTHNLLNRKNMNLMKENAIIVNTARGALINTRALVEVLSHKKLGGAALDVLEEEGLVKEEAQLLSKKYEKEDLEKLIENHILLTFDNVIITPHNAFNSQEALQRILETTVDNIKNIKRGKYINTVK